MRATDVAWLTASETATAVRIGELRAQDVVEAVLGRVERLNPSLVAYVHVDAGAAAGRGPLAGVTLAVKDTQPVAGMPWTFGSRRWRDRVADQDSRQVGWARGQGATIVGKANAPELAASVGTVNELFGATRNPWRLDVTPGGSSGGSGAAVAAGLCALAFGDDMGGSIRIPASCCGVAGLRPSPGRVPVELPDPTNLSVRGPLARSVADLRLGFALMIGDPDVAAAPSPPPPAGGLRIGVVEASPVPVEPACLEAVGRAARTLADAGHRLEPVPWDPEPVERAYRVVRPASVAHYPGEPHEYGEAAGQLIARGRATTTRDLMGALQAGLTAADRIRERLLTLDAILTPTLGRLPMPIAEVPPFLSDAWSAYVQFVLPVSFAGLPAVSVPAGQHGGLPVGVQVVGRRWDEWRLLALAAELEALPGFGFQRPPGLD
jgi:amidase